MTIYQLLVKLGEAGIKIWVEGGELRFRAPKGALTPDLKEQVGTRKQELIQYLQQSRRGEAVTNRKIYPVSRQAPLRLSYGQERLWFLAQLEPNSSAYHIPILLEIKGDLDIAKLDIALATIFQRHEILRTVIVEREDSSEPALEQKILPNQRSSLRYEDLSRDSEFEQEERRLKIIESARSTPFSLSEGPLARSALMKLADQHFQLIMTLHHIIADGWSMSVMVNELITLYSAQTRSQTEIASILPPLSIQYADYAHWQRQWLAGDEREQQLTFWQEELDQVPVLELPLDKPRPASIHPRGSAHFFSWPSSIRESAEAFSQQQGVTLFMTLVAAYQVFLSRYSGQDEFAIGTPIANRVMPEQEPMIGFFVNTLALKAKLDHQQRFIDLVQVVQRQTLQAYAHQNLPFEQIVDALGVSREMSCTPLFQVMFSLQKASDVSLRMPGLSVEGLTLSRRSSKCDLNLTLSETTEGFKGELEYATDLFEHETIVRMESQLLQLVENLLSEPNCPLNQISMLSNAQRQTILKDWNPPMRSFDPAESDGVAALFEQQVRKQPKTIALQQGGIKLSYDELNCRANHSAQALISAGVKPDDVVVICAQRSVERIIALLAIVKAGAVYMPLEIELPAERLTTLLDQSDAAWIMVDPSQQESFQSVAQRGLLTTLPYPELRGSVPDVENLQRPANPEQRAYIMFTSGSTGVPKGIVVPQRGIIRLVKDNDFLELDSTTSLLHYAPLAFDASTFEIWGALLNGGRLVVAPSGLLELEQLSQEIRDKGINTLWLTAALFHAMAEHAPQGFAPLRTLLAGGDQLNPRSVKKLLYRFPHLTLINGYGPTENTTFTTCQVMHSARQVRHSVSIGKAIRGTQVYVLNEALQPQAIGVPGELCTAGHGVALGYLHELNDFNGSKSKVFISNPFAEEYGHGPILYRTGDKARFLSDGSLEFLGRLDQQIKIRGFRIELGEIESTLSGLPWIANSVVAVQEQNQQKYLVAYLESAEDRLYDAVSNAAFIQRTRRQLLHQLPDYMQPLAYKIITTLPVTVNGKVDRKALPPITLERASDAISAPTSELQKALLSIWQAVLDRDEIGIHDNFFELGGHSLLATQITSRIRHSLHYELPVRELFAAPTIAQTALWIEEHGQRQVVGQSKLTKRPAGEKTPATDAQRRLWVLEKLSPGSSAYLIPSALRVRGAIDMRCVNLVVNTLIERHEALRTAIVQEEDSENISIYQQVKEDVRLNIEREKCPDDFSLHNIQALIDAEANQGFSLDHAPLMRVRVIALNQDDDGKPEDQDSLLLLTMHHIISDGWSMTVLIKEFVALYEAYSKNQENPLPVPVLQYGDYASWQQRYLSAEQLEQSLQFWLAQVADKEPVIKLPTDFPRPASPAASGAMLHRTFDVALSQEIQALSEREGVSLFMLTLAVWELLLSRVSGQQSFNVGAPVAGRTLAETEDMIGFFINTAVFGASIDPENTFREHLYHIQQQSLEGFAHQHFPFEILVEHMQPERSLSYSPLFQVFLNVLNLPATKQQVAGLWIEDLSEAQQHYMAKFDLSLYVQPREQGLKFSMLYRSDCFAAGSVDKHLSQLETLFTQVVEDIDRPLSAFTVREKADKTDLPDPRQSLGLPDLPLPQQQISQQASVRETNIAVSDAEDSCTYGELESWSNQLAHALTYAGLAAEMPVAIYAHRDGALVYSILAAIKAGVAFVILDPAHPAPRLIKAIKEVEAEAVLVLENAPNPSPELAQAFAERKCLSVPGIRKWKASRPFEKFSDQAPQPQTNHMDQLSYLMLTSGTMGSAKVIQGSLKPIAALLEWYPKAFAVSDTDVFSLFSGLGHDPLLRDILLPLGLGARIEIPADEIMKKPGPLRQWAMDRRVSVSHLTPAFAQVMLHGGEKSPPCDSYRYLLFSGDRLGETVVKATRQFAPAASLINCYGTTETPQIHSWCEIKDVPQAVIPVGKGSPFSQLILVNESKQLAGVGETAEIFVRSSCLALGYKDAELSEQAFLPNPLGEEGMEEQFARWYRTGDFGRYRQDGQVEVLGRKDKQVKIRGYRIELSDIEADLKTVCGIEQLVVLVEKARDMEAQLVAYVCVESLDSEAMREQLRNVLPEYMIPNRFIAVAEMPLTPNGKVDFRALQTMARNIDKPARNPETETELVLATIWAEVLRRPTVGINENFFELGGQSLAATQVIARIHTHFQIDFPLKLVFEINTIERMAEYIDNALWMRNDATNNLEQEHDDWEEIEI